LPAFSRSRGRQGQTQADSPKVGTDPMDSLAEAQMRQEAILAGEKVPIDPEEGRSRCRRRAAHNVEAPKSKCATILGELLTPEPFEAQDKGKLRRPLGNNLIQRTGCYTTNRLLQLLAFTLCRRPARCSRPYHLRRCLFQRVLWSFHPSRPRWCWSRQSCRPSSKSRKIYWNRRV
jgi:hypothetical protein